MIGDRAGGEPETNAEPVVIGSALDVEIGEFGQMLGHHRRAAAIAASGEDHARSRLEIHRYAEVPRAHADDSAVLDDQAVDLHVVAGVDTAQPRALGELVERQRASTLLAIESDLMA